VVILLVMITATHYNGTGTLSLIAMAQGSWRPCSGHQSPPHLLAQLASILHAADQLGAVDCC